MMDELLPCKQCGQPPRIGSAVIGGVGYAKYSGLDCNVDSCPARTIEEAAKDWNERLGREPDNDNRSAA